MGVIDDVTNKNFNSQSFANNFLHIERTPADNVAYFINIQCKWC